MKVELLAVGKLKAGPERELVARYSERFRQIGRGLQLDGPRLVELSESAARRDADRKAEEAQGLLEAMSEGARLILFDECGKACSSEAFAHLIRDARDAGLGTMAFAIGGADGHGDALRAHASTSLCFGAMTMPHQLVRVLVLEQLYRAGTLLAGHPYHRP